MISNNNIKVNILIAVIFAIVMPIVAGNILNTYVHITFISVPIHSSLEASGGAIAIIISLIFHMKYRKLSTITHFNWSTLALISMAIIDIFHASVMPGKLFVWLHSIAVFVGGLFFITVWCKERKVSRLTYTLVPLLFISFSIIFSSLSIIFVEYVPEMINIDKSFTTTANYLNIIGGVGFFIASIKFVVKYIETKDVQELLFAGHTMLFGVAGILFVSSVIWDMQWWLWHLLRFSAYSIAFYFLYTEYYKEMKEIEEVNSDLLKTTDELSQKIAYIDSFVDAANENNIITRSDLNGNIVYANENFCKVTGYTEDEVIGKPHSIIRHPDSDASMFKELWATIKSKKTWRGTLKNLKKDGGFYWVEINISPLLDKDGEVYEYIAIRHDITKLVLQQDSLEGALRTDTLTGLGNRYKLIEDIKKADKPSLGLINFDNFREINDLYGHDFGDSVIDDLAAELFTILLKQKDKKLYRIQGDEFAILSEDDNKEEFITLINNIVDELSVHECVFDFHQISMQVTATVSFENSNENLFTTADMMMKVAKKSRKKVLVYDESLSLEKKYENNLKWSKKLTIAIDNDKLVPYYQPIVNNKSGEFEKYECLVRLIDEDETVVSPFFFLNIAKRTKQYLDLTRTVIDKSFKTFESLDVEFSINLTIQDIMDQDLKEFIYSKLEKSKMGHRVVFEIVESEGIENFDKVIEFIEKVKSNGCKIAIDDFGTGYSNFEYLLQLKADYIKIDGSMIKNIDKDKDAQAVVSTVVDFAKKMNIKTIAEFIESETIQTVVKDMGIDYSQGYYFSEPKAEPPMK